MHLLSIFFPKRSHNFTLINFNIIIITVLIMTEFAGSCIDESESCMSWVQTDPEQCVFAKFVRNSCPQSCGRCNETPKRFNISALDDKLKPLKEFIGIWRSDHHGKAYFPTIPTFTFGEQLEFSLFSLSGTVPTLNYSTFAWSMDKTKDELHSEHGFIVAKRERNEFALTTVMSNGFVTVEEGVVKSKGKVRFSLVDIGRISFSRDMPVHNLVREWSIKTILGQDILESRLSMQTQTHGMMEHVVTIYHKIYPTLR